MARTIDQPPRAPRGYRPDRPRAGQSGVKRCETKSDAWTRNIRLQFWIGRTMDGEVQRAKIGTQTIIAAERASRFGWAAINAGEI